MNVSDYAYMPYPHYNAKMSKQIAPTTAEINRLRAAAALIATVSKPGGRPYDEECCAQLRLPNGLESWVIVDVLGGRGGGDIYSELAAQNILNSFHVPAEISAELVAGHHEDRNRLLRSLGNEGKPLLRTKAQYGNYSGMAVFVEC